MAKIEAAGLRVTQSDAANALTVLLAFVNAFAGLIAAYPGPELGALQRLVCAALVAGCGAALLFLHPPGRGEPSDKTVERMVDLAEERMKRRAPK